MTAPTLFTVETPAAPAAAGSRPLAVGLDMALSTSGIAGPGWTDTIRTGQLRAEERLQYIVDTATTFYRHADFVAIEGAAYSHAKQVGHDEMSALRWMIRCDLRKRGIPFAVITPDSRTIYATGKARWKDDATGRKLTPRQVKGLVRAEASSRYSMLFEGPTRYDEADAYVLMAMAMDWLGHPLAEVPSSHSRALKGVPWPTTPVAVAS